MFCPKAVALSTFGLALLAGIASAQVQFASAVNYSTPTHPAGIVAADFNRDGIIDLAVATDNPDRVTILLGTGDGQFAAPIRHTIPNGRGLGALVAGDFDGNGTIDLAVVMKNTATVAIMNNNGSGYFLLGALIHVGDRPVDLQAGDLNGDGFLDLVSANKVGNSISIIRNSGNGSFTVETIPVGNDPRDVALGDLNGDGSLDIAVSLHGARAIATLLNTGGVFSAPVNTSISQRPEGIAIADVNHDGYNDVLFTAGDLSVGSNFVGLMNGNGAGGLATARFFPTGGLLTTRIVAADLDNDGFADVAVTNESDQSVSVLTGSALGLSAPVILAAGAHPNGIVIADLNADGRLDVACSNSDSDNTSVFLAIHGRGCAGDFNRDGVVDFNDYLDFMDLFALQASGADFNHDSVVDGMDYLDFLSSFTSGC